MFAGEDEAAMENMLNRQPEHEIINKFINCTYPKLLVDPGRYSDH